MLTATFGGLLLPRRPLQSAGLTKPKALTWQKRNVRETTIRPHRRYLRGEFPMKEVTFTFKGTREQVYKLFGILREAGVPCHYVTVEKLNTLVIPVQEVSIEEADTILNEDY